MKYPLFLWNVRILFITFKTAGNVARLSFFYKFLSPLEERKYLDNFYLKKKKLHIF